LLHWYNLAFLDLFSGAFIFQDKDALAIVSELLADYTVATCEWTSPIHYNKERSDTVL
jgi:uncharacterized protein involved in type VI secretion and phage assembly